MALSRWVGSLADFGSAPDVIAVTVFEWTKNRLNTIELGLS